MAEDRKIDCICKGLGRYYQSKLNKQYDKLFSRFCDDSELDDEAVQADLEEGVENSILVGFDENFPYNGPIADRDSFIYNKIKQCLDPNITFIVDPPKFDKQFFEITAQQYDETKIIYQKQCPKIYNCGMEKDEAFLTLLAVSRKNNFDYLQHLVDDYFRSKVQNINIENGSWNVTKWINNDKHPHFAQLKKINYKVLNKSTPYELAFNAINSFGKRCCPQLLFEPLKCINDSLETIIRYIESVTVAIGNNLNISGAEKTVRAMCPLQIDILFASQPPKIMRKQIYNVSNNDDDDDEDEKKNVETQLQITEDDQWVDCIGNIKQKLNANNLKYVLAKIEQGRPHFKAFTKAFNELDKNNNQHKNENTICFLHKKRLIALVDRRKDMNQDEKKDNDVSKDSVYVYTPPSNCALIPSDVLGLWYVSSSRTCLLPDMEYKNGKKAEQEEDKINENTANGLRRANITSGFHAKGALLTISFHVKSKDEVKMYLYFNGQMIRFMPEDIKTVLPLLFNMDYEDNKSFIENEQEIDPIINNIKRWIKDAYFDAFQRSYR